jgi:hypothetical protein
MPERTLRCAPAQCFGDHRNIVRLSPIKVPCSAGLHEWKKMTATAGRFFGWRVVSAAFVLAIFGWGIGFYGPPVFLSAVHDARGWPVALISTAVTVHFLVGAFAGRMCPHFIAALASQQSQRLARSAWRLASSVGPQRFRLGSYSSQPRSAERAGAQ